jgi:uncharacterized membrane protein
LKIFVLVNPFYSIGIGIGTFIANIASPFAGPWDLIFMPITDIVGGFMAWRVYRAIRGKTIFPSMILYATTTGLSVGIMLSAFGLGYWYVAALPIIASELIILLVASPMLWKAMEWIHLN